MHPEEGAEARIFRANWPSKQLRSVISRYMRHAAVTGICRVLRMCSNDTLKLLELQELLSELWWMEQIAVVQLLSGRGPVLPQRFPACPGGSMVEWDHNSLHPLRQAIS